jgi:hypothetical protein
MKIVSCRALAKLITEDIDKLLFLKEFWSLHPGTGFEKSLRNACEVYGKEVFCYINTFSLYNRKMMENWLKEKGLKFNSNYSVMSSTVEIQVTYFKGWKWDE